MKKILFLLALLPLISKAQENGKKFKISGKMLHFKQKVDWVFLQYRTNGDWVKDSTKPKNNSYEFKGNLAEPSIVRLIAKYATPGEIQKTAMTLRKDMAPVFVYSGNIKVTSVDSFSNITVKGSEANNEYDKLNNLAKLYEARLAPLYEAYSAYSKANDKENMAKTDAEIDKVEKEKNENVFGNYVKNNPASPIAFYALQQFAGWDLDADKVEPVFNTLSEENRSFPSAIQFKENLETAKKTGIGKTAMDFTQNDTLGIPVSLSAFRGRYILVDFWASWCGPCRAENPNVVKVFNKYKDRNFHIIGVSLDREGQNAKWLKAIHDDKLTWTQVSDLKYWENAVAKQYGIKAIPQNLLIDPAGKIVAKNLRGEELEAKLGELIK